MPFPAARCVIGIDVGGTNTDSVVLRQGNVLASHKTPTTPEIQQSVKLAITAVVEKAGIDPRQIASVNIGTTQFLNAVLEQDPRKLDRVAVIRLCGPYSKGSPPFVDFSPGLRGIIEGHVGYVDGGYQVDGALIAPLSTTQLREHAKVIKSKSIRSVVIIGIYSPSNPSQEEEAHRVLALELGPGHNISCSHTLGRLGFLERENASILNASLRNFARTVIGGYVSAVQNLGNSKLYITLNDGTLSKASVAADHPVRCFSSGPTNSAIGAAFLANLRTSNSADDMETLVVDVGGTTTDICSLLPTGYPRQSAACVRIAGVRTNFTIPDVHNIALGGGSVVRTAESRVTVGPDSVGAKVGEEAIGFGGQIMTATDLVLDNERTRKHVSREVQETALREMSRALGAAIDLVKTKAGEARVVLVGGGSILFSKDIAGVKEIIRPKHLEVANAIGAAMGRICGTVDQSVVIGSQTVDEEIQKARALAVQRCRAAGGDPSTIEMIELDVVPNAYVTNGSTRIFVRVVGDLIEDNNDYNDSDAQLEDSDLFIRDDVQLKELHGSLDVAKGSSYEAEQHVDPSSYRPRIEGDLWYLSEIDLQFLQDGTGILAVGSCGEPYPAYLACLLALRNGEDLVIRRQDTFPEDGVVLGVGFMGSPSVYMERIPGEHEVTDAMKTVLQATGLSTFEAVVPNEIGGMNSFEALLAAHRFNKSTLDTDQVGRAYPMLWQTTRCLADVPVTPAALADGAGKSQLFRSGRDNFKAEEMMRKVCTTFGSLAGLCVNPLNGAEAKSLPRNSYSHAWSIGRSMAISRSLKRDPIDALVKSQSGVLLFSGRIISVERNVNEGFTRGSVRLKSFPDAERPASFLHVDVENENLIAVLHEEGEEERVLAVCPDLITFLDMANGSPLGISDYKYGARVWVIALRAPPIWLTKRGLEMGGPRAFGLEMDHVDIGGGEYEAPKSVWEIFGDA